MKKIVNIIVLAAILCLFAACQKESAVVENNKAAAEVTITASFPSLTKVTYAEDGSSHNLVGSWVAGDEIFGFTGDGTTVSFEVKSVDSTTGVATLEQKTSVALTDGTKVYAIYCPGKTASDLSGQTLAVDFSEQTADVIPVLLLSTATVSGSAINFAFSNAVSIIGVKNPVFPAETSADKLVRFTVSGHEIVSSGVVSVSGGSLVFTGNAPDKFINKTVNAAPVLGSGSFTINDPVYIVIPAGPVANISAVDNKSHFFVYPLNKTAEVSKYYLIAEKTFPVVDLPTSSKVSAGGVVWADRNFGAAGKQDMGDVYKWSDIKKIYTERTSGTPYVNYDSNHTGGFDTYEGECYYSSSAYTKYNKTDNKTVLDAVDDIIQLTYPGSGWRMPTLDEFKALFGLTVTTTAGTANSNGTTVTQDDNSVFFRSYIRVCSPSSTDKKTLSKFGRFWTSTITPDNLTTTGGNPDYVQMNGNGKQATNPTYGNAYRHSGFLIRPVK